MKKTGKLLNVAGKVAKMEAIKTKSPWPPICGAILHQPKRPQKKQ